MRRIFYEKSTGNVVLSYAYKAGTWRETTIDEDHNSYTALKERVKDTIGCIELLNGEYEQDFQECTAFRVNILTLEIEFDYSAMPEETVFQKPLTAQIAELNTTVDIILTEIIPSLGGM